MRNPRLQVIDIETRGDAPQVDSYMAGCIARIERMLRARALLWQATLARFKPDHLWGVPQVPHGEIDALLACPPLGVDPLEALPEDARQELRAAADMAGTLTTLRAGMIESRLVVMEEAFALAPGERDLLLLAALPEFDLRYRRLIGYLLDDAALSWPSVEFAAACLAPLHGDIRKALALDGVLVSTGLVEITVPGGSSIPRSQRGLKACAEAVDWLRGGEGIDRDALGDVTLLHSIVGQPPATPDAVLSVARLMREEPALTVWAHGPGATDLHPFQQLAQAAGLPLLSCPPAVAADGAKLRAAMRSARLHGALLHLPIAPLVDGAAREIDLAALLARHAGPVALGAQTALRETIQITSRPAVDLNLPLPDFEQRAAFWNVLLASRSLANGKRAPAYARDLADRYRLTYSRMEAAVAQADMAARLRAPGNPKLEYEDLVGGCRRQSAPGNVELARRIVPGQVAIDLSDLVLPPATHLRLADLVQRLGQRRRVLTSSGLAERLPLGHGTVTLFTGPAGTGKTIAAILIAKRLGLDLLKADLGSLVSKYVGETEQRLDRLFAAAEIADAVLFFDEADALFGRRGEVKEARDRWANLETNYLLQRIEEFDGIVILSTNLRQNVDEAFMRRIDVAIDFPIPDAGLRKQLWLGLIPSGVERPADANLDRLAQALPLAGGHIKSIVVDAVHRAYAAHDAEGGRPRLTLRHLVESAARTYEKLGRPVGPSEFGTEWLGWLREREGKR